MALDDAASISIDDEDRVISGIKKDGICCLGADAVEREQLFAQLSGWLGKHAGE